MKDNIFILSFFPHWHQRDSNDKWPILLCWIIDFWNPQWLLLVLFFFNSSSMSYTSPYFEGQVCGNTDVKTRRVFEVSSLHHMYITTVSAGLASFSKLENLRLNMHRRLLGETEACTSFVSAYEIILPFHFDRSSILSNLGLD